MEIARKYRRSAARRNNSKHKKNSRLFLPVKSVNALFSDPNHAEVVQEGLESALSSSLKGKTIPKFGYRLVVRLIHTVNNNGKRMTAALVGEQTVRADHSSHFALVGYFDDGSLPKIDFGSDNIPADLNPYFEADSELRVPFSILKSPNLKPHPVGNFWVYHFRFNMSKALQSEVVSAKAALPLEHGYIGVTRRPFIVRVGEHLKDIENGGGHLFHHSWRALKDKEIPFYPIFQLAAVAASEDEMYEIEEEGVSSGTLNPQGLNMIPGGRDGIGVLKGMGFQEANLENRDKCLAEAFTSTNARAIHYRRPHIREYRRNLFTYVRGCWVNGSGEELELQ